MVSATNMKTRCGMGMCELAHTLIGFLWNAGGRHPVLFRAHRAIARTSGAAEGLGNENSRLFAIAGRIIAIWQSLPCRGRVVVSRKPPIWRRGRSQIDRPA